MTPNFDVNGPFVATASWSRALDNDVLVKMSLQQLERARRAKCSVGWLRSNNTSRSRLVCCLLSPEEGPGLQCEEQIGKQAGINLP